jgi:eukaryotic-like serine/threonine-protein kinase
VFKYLARQPFWVNLLIVVILIFLMMVLFLGSLSWFTNHGAYLKVPMVKGKNSDEAIKLLESKGFEVIIQDSLYVDSLPGNTIIKQLPEADATVKRNREVFLTINKATAPPVAMPKLEGLSYRFALDLLLKNHLALGDTAMKPDFMKGSVLEQKYNGDKIEAGAPVPWGSKIDLVIGSAMPEMQVAVPDLLGLTYSDAKSLLDKQGIIIAAVITQPNVSDTASAFIYKQSPEPFDEEKKQVYIKPGQTVDLWLSKGRATADSTKQ